MLSPSPLPLCPDELGYSLHNSVSASLLSRPTTSGWGVACTRFGISCTQFLPPIPMSYAIENNIRFDLIGFFNTLDHLDDPLIALKEALDLSKAVVVRIHPVNGGGAQHGYFLPPAFWSNLSSLIPQVSVTSLTEEVRSKLNHPSLFDDFYLLVKN